MSAEPAPAVQHGPVRPPSAPRWARLAGLATLTAAPAVAVVAVVVGGATGHRPPWTALVVALLGSAVLTVGLGHVGRWQSDAGTEAAQQATTGLVLGYGALAFAAAVGATAAMAGSHAPVEDSFGGYSYVTQDARAGEAEDRRREAPGVLRGTVRDAEGSLVAGADVVAEHDGIASDDCPHLRAARTGPDGTWFLSVCQLDPGARYRVAARHDAGTARGPAVDVTAGRTTDVDLVVR